MTHDFFRFPHPAERHQNPRALVKNGRVRLVGRFHGCQLLPSGLHCAEFKPALGGLNCTPYGAFPQGSSAYQVIAGDPTAHADDVAALEAICAYYDANKAQMIAAYNQQQATNAAYQQWLAAHPPVQPNTVINYWPVKSRVYLPSGH